MSDLLDRIENDAYKLSSQERAFLADRLLSSLGDNTLSDIDATWIAEVEHRYEEYKEGKRKGIVANEVFAAASLTLK
jgi:putative addiction module component (TIGR02574 family)